MAVRILSLVAALPSLCMLCMPLMFRSQQPQKNSHQSTARHTHTHNHTITHTDTQTHRHTDTCTHIHTDTHTHMHTHTHLPEELDLYVGPKPT